MKNLTIHHRLGTYPVLIGNNLTERLCQWLKKAQLGPRLILVSHPEVMDLHGRTLLAALTSHGFEVVALTVPSGEEHKSLDEACRLYGELSDCRAERNTPILALGGGVIGDLAGFAAATYLRGLPLVHLPTTLLAQVDSSLGGKTAVNCRGLKNLVGVFYPPRAVFSDTETLKTLPQREIASGLSEMIKSAVIMEPRLFSLMERNIDKIKALESRVVEDAVFLAASVKAAVVSRDERESGLRQVLNLGHTLGHAVEAVSGFGVSHGESVAIGMVAAGRIANRLRLFQGRDLARLERLIAMAGLPTALPCLELPALMTAMKHDKKVTQGRLRFVLPVSTGRVVVREVDPALVAEVLAEI
jgi:3-dehydroquinate synthase